MTDNYERLSRLIRLVHALEESRPYVTTEDLRRAARAQNDPTLLSGVLKRLLEQAMALQVLLTDNRLRVTRTGHLRPTRIHRVNGRHALVREVLDHPGR